MTAALSLNGIAFPVRDGAATPSTEIVGSTGRAVDGTTWRDVRARKRTFALGTTPLAPLTAFAFRDLVTGLHDVWNFESGLYSARGTASSLAGGSVRGSSCRFGSFGLTVPTGGTFTVYSNFSSGSGWSLTWWQYEVSTWYLYTESSTGKWRNGATSAHASYWTISSDHAVYTQTTGISLYLDDVVQFPWGIPSDWHAQMNTAVMAWPLSPRLSLSGLLVDGNSSTLTVTGEPQDSTYLQAYLTAGTWQPAAVQFSCRLVEV